MKIIFHSHANKTHFHKKSCASSLILKVRVCGTRKLPIIDPFNKLRLAEGKGTFRHQHVETPERAWRRCYQRLLVVCSRLVIS